MDPSWSETGDRYLLKLFRDYVFHQVDENNDPVLNLAHVVSCLNKVGAEGRRDTRWWQGQLRMGACCYLARRSLQLDTGHPEKILLTSRDGQSCLIVSYRDLKHCVETTFKELQRRK